MNPKNKITKTYEISNNFCNFAAEFVKIPF